MNFESIKNIILNLCENEDFDQAENEKNKAIPFIKKCLVTIDEDGNKLLEFFAQLAGDHDSYEKFSLIINSLISEKFIKQEYADKLHEICPVNRWL
jgi:hypothetical protein